MKVDILKVLRFNKIEKANSSFDESLKLIYFNDYNITVSADVLTNYLDNKNKQLSVGSLYLFLSGVIDITYYQKFMLDFISVIDKNRILKDFSSKIGQEFFISVDLIDVSREVDARFTENKDFEINYIISDLLKCEYNDIIQDSDINITDYLNNYSHIDDCGDIIKIDMHTLASNLLDDNTKDSNQLVESPPKPIIVNTHKTLKEILKINHQNPVIIVPSDTTIHNVMNFSRAKYFTINQKFWTTNDEEKIEGFFFKWNISSSDRITAYLETSESGKKININDNKSLKKNKSDLTLKVVNAAYANKLDDKQWQSIGLVFLNGTSWQCKNWPFENLSTQFQTLKGVYVMYEEDTPPPFITQNNIEIIRINRHKRHTDGLAYLKIIQLLDKQLDLPRNLKMFINLSS